MVESIHEIKECPDCASMDIIYNDRRQQVICKECGLIYEPLTPKEEETYFSAPRRAESKQQTQKAKSQKRTIKARTKKSTRARKKRI